MDLKKECHYVVDFDLSEEQGSAVVHGRSDDPDSQLEVRRCMCSGVLFARARVCVCVCVRACVRVWCTRAAPVASRAKET